MHRVASNVSLSDIERSYLVEVDREATGLPSRPRRSVVLETAEILSGRPPAETADELMASLGDPSDIVRQFRVDAGLEGPIPLWRRWTLQRGWARAAQLGVVMVIALAGLAAFSYYSATPQIEQSCGGMIASDVETLDAAGETEYRTTFRHGDRLGIRVCPHAQDPGVVIERVYLPSPALQAIQPVGWELDTERDAVTLRGDASDHRPWRPTDTPWLGQVVVWFEMEYCDFEGSISMDTLWLEYSYRGRTRSTPVDLLSTYTVDSAGQCTDVVREATEAQSRVWSSFARPGAGYGPDDLGPLELWPESVSRDLCRYLSGPPAVTDDDGQPTYDEFEALSARAVFNLDDPAIAERLVDGAVFGICPEFDARRDELVAMLEAHG